MRPRRPPVDFDTVIAALIRCQSNRDLLLSWIPDFVYGITTARSPVEQIHHDLMAMLRSPRLIGIVGRPIELAMRAFIDAIPDADYDQFSADVRAVICG